MGSVAGKVKVKGKGTVSTPAEAAENLRRIIRDPSTPDDVRERRTQQLHELERTLENG